MNKNTNNLITSLLILGMELMFGVKSCNSANNELSDFYHRERLTYPRHKINDDFTCC